MLLKEVEVKGEKVRRRLERHFSEWEKWGRVKQPFEKEVDVDGRLLKVRIEEVEAGVKQSKTREHLVVKVRVKVEEDGRKTIVEKEARFFKNGGRVYGYVNIHGNTEEERKADYIHTAAVLKALGVESWSRWENQIRLTRGALDALMKLEPVCKALELCG
ncbi:hypothetical protein ODS41_01770 [Pyrobaculum sp. 3827-6]|uniref:hypothetical protein n=1 Tax=Pyrobaculum sp. 3827-6 TaxID=2983604 RepID=UPI0021D8D75D|nr:hypothetical protein [Pyrobaculum sp. 3827-6]MCU7786658.1 hypothetical protein [Pyrobaculum sp. 3827-6]